MPLNIGDYLADTMHLTCLQHGIYFQLLMHCFKRGSVPAEERTLARITKLPTLTFRKEAPAVLAMFQTDGNAWRHRRVDAERAKAQELSEKRREAAAKGWPRQPKPPGFAPQKSTGQTPPVCPTEKRYPNDRQPVDKSNGALSKSTNFAYAPTTTTTKEVPTPSGVGTAREPASPAPRRSRSRAARCPADWQPNADLIAFGFQLGFTAAQVFAAAAAMRDWSAASPKGTKLDWNAAFRNWLRSDASRRPNGGYAAPQRESRNAFCDIIMEEMQRRENDQGAGWDSPGVVRLFGRADRSEPDES